MNINKNQHQDILKLAIQAGREAVRIRAAGNLNPRMKTGDNYSVVTDADMAAHNILVNGISRIFPGDKIISEEDKKHDVSGSYKNAWVIDPIDGSSNFNKGGSQFGVLIAYVENGEPVYGVAYYPDDRFNVVYYTDPDKQKSFRQKVEIKNGVPILGDPAELHSQIAKAEPRIAQRYTDVKDFLKSEYSVSKYTFLTVLLA